MIGLRLRAVRADRGLSVAKLATRCADLGMPKLNRDVITNIERLRRDDVGVGELFVLATALDVPPTALLISEDAEPLAVTPTYGMWAPDLLDWVSGSDFPPVWARGDKDAFTLWGKETRRLRLLRRFQRHGLTTADSDEDEAAKAYADLVNDMIESGVYPPPLPAPLIAKMTEHGFRYADQVKAADE